MEIKMIKSLLLNKITLPGFLLLLLMSGFGCGITEQPNHVVLRARSGAGMFSILDDALGLAKGYENGFYLGAKIDFAKTGEYYDRKHGGNWWGYYFEPVELGTMHDNPEEIEQPYYYSGNEHVESGNMSRLEVNEFIKKYIHILPEIQEKIDNIVQSKFDGYNVITVHYRGTDKISEAPRTKYEKVTVELRNQITDLNGKEYRIFVATDEDAFLTYMKDEFPDKVIWYEEAIRSTDGNPVHMGGSHSRHHVGEDAIIDCILLSKGNLLIRTSSNLSRWSTYFNPHVPVIELSKRY